MELSGLSLEALYDRVHEQDSVFLFLPKMENIYYDIASVIASLK